MVDWLSDLSWVPNGAVVLISCADAPGPKAKPPPKKSAAAAPKVTTVADGSSSGSDKQGGGVASAAVPEAAGGQAEQQADEDEEEALALAALGRIRESYRTRAKERRSASATGAARSDVSDQEAGKRMLDKKREVESTAQSRQASFFRTEFFQLVLTAFSRQLPRGPGRVLVYVLRTLPFLRFTCACGHMHVRPFAAPALVGEGMKIWACVFAIDYVVCWACTCSPTPQVGQKGDVNCRK